jgi:hypothetical protein
MSEPATQLSEEQRQQVLDTELTTKVLVIAQMCKLIEGCTQRGAFKSEELSYVGGLYDSFSAIIKQATDKVKSDAETPVISESMATISEVDVEGAVEE